MVLSKYSVKFIKVTGKVIELTNQNIQNYNLGSDQLKNKKQ